jgi:hypothetical protein
MQKIELDDTSCVLEHLNALNLHHLISLHGFQMI